MSHVQRCECNVVEGLVKENIKLKDEYNCLLKATSQIQEHFRRVCNANAQLPEDEFKSLRLTAYCPDFTRQKPKETL